MGPLISLLECASLHVPARGGRSFMRRVKQLVPGRETIILVSASTSASSRWKGLLCGKLFKGNFGSSVFDERRRKRRHFEKLNL